VLLKQIDHYLRAQKNRKGKPAVTGAEGFQHGMDEDGLQNKGISDEPGRQTLET